MRRAGIHLVVASALALGACAPAFGSPVTISAPHRFISNLRGFPLGPATIAAWSWQDGRRTGRRSRSGRLWDRSTAHARNRCDPLPAGPSILAGAYRPAGASRFSATRRIESDGAGAPSLELVGSTVQLADAMHTPAGPVPRLRTSGASLGPARDVVAAAGGLTGVTLAGGDTTAGVHATWMVPQAGGDGAGIGSLGGLDADGEALAPLRTPSEDVSEIAR